MEPASNRFSLGIFCLFGFISMMGIGISFPTFSFIALKPGAILILNRASINERVVVLGALLAIASLFSLIAAPIAGSLADQKGRKPVLLAALFLLVIGPILSAIGIWWKSLSILLISRIVSGIGSGGGAVLGAAIADISPPEKKAKNFALLTTASSLGFMIGPLIGGKLSQGGNYTNPFLVVACLTFMNLLLMTFWFKDRFQIKKDEGLNKKSILSDLKLVFNYTDLRLLLFCIPLFNMGFVIYWQFISINWIEQYGLNEAQVGNVYAYGAAWFALCSGLLIRPILSRFRNLSIAFFSSLLLGLLILILLFRTGIGLFWICIPFQEFFLALLGPTAMAFISNAVKNEDQGKVMGVLQSLGAAAFAVSPLLGGLISGINYNAHILFGGIIILLFSCIIFFGYRKQIFG